MDSHLKQWRDDQEESDELPSPPPAKFPRLLLQHLHLHHDHHQQPPSESESDHHHPPVLPLFLPPPPEHTHQPPTRPTSTLPSYPDSKPPLPPSAYATSRLSSRMGGQFSIGQWQELELQAVIFRHMVAGASIPPELLQLVKKSLLNSSPYYLQNYNHFHPSLLQTSGYWGRAAMDPEPGRCRRTDGKKWRCSRDVVPAHKYCERHVHRGRNRSRKPVEYATSTATATATATATLSSQSVAGFGGPHFSLSGSTSTSSSLEIFQLNQGASEPKADRTIIFDQSDTSGDGKSNGQVLRHFFDDWPRSGNTGDSGGSPANSATCLSISTPGGNRSLDFLKLSTGNAEGDLSRRVDGRQNPNEWSGGNQVPAMGGPLAEALRSSTGSSPTSVLHQLPRSASGASYVSA